MSLGLEGEIIVELKAEVKKVDSIKREINIEASGDIVKNKFEEVFKSIGASAKVPGFRQGHVPRDMLEKHYSSMAHEQVVRELIPDLYKEAIEQQKLDVIELPEISEVKLDRITIAFKATVSVSPEIALKNYKGVKLSYKRIGVGADELKRALDSLKESRKIDALDDASARSLGYPDLATFEQVLEKQIFVQKQSQERQRLESELIAKVTKDLNFSVPQSLVDRQLEDMARQAKLDLALKGVARQEIENRNEQLRKELRPQAHKQVLVYLVLAEIAKKENIPQDEHMSERVMEFLLREAQWEESK